MLHVVIIIGDPNNPLLVTTCACRDPKLTLASSKSSPAQDCPFLDSDIAVRVPPRGFPHCLTLHDWRDEIRGPGVIQQVLQLLLTVDVLSFLLLHLSHRPVFFISLFDSSAGCSMC